MTATFAAIERQVGAIARDFRTLRQVEEAADTPRRSPVELAADLGIGLDPWQRDALTTTVRNILLLASRQAGKSTVSALLAVHGAVYDPGSLTLLLSPSERQSKRLLRVVRRYYDALRGVVPATSEGLLHLELRNGSEILALPGKEATVRGYSSVDLIVIDEAARVADDLYTSVRPMLAVSGGRLVALSTPWGQRGWFHQEYTEGGPEWHRATVTAYDVPRIDRAWLEAERRRMGEWWFAQEYEVRFMDNEWQIFATDLILAAADADMTPLFDQPAPVPDLEGADDDLAPLFAEVSL